MVRSNCPHVDGAKGWAWSEITRLKQGACHVCHVKNPNLWLCLMSNCSFVGCSEQVKDHSIQHSQTENHPLSMNLTTLRIWCNACKCEVFVNANHPPLVITGYFGKTCSNRKHQALPENSAPTNSKDRKSGYQLPEDSDSDCDENFYRPRGLTGLRNLGNTCYMNAALQALSNCQPLTRFFIDCSMFVKPELNPMLSKSYQKLMVDMWHKKRHSYVVPSSIYNGINIVHPMFRGYSQQDTQEFLRCFMDQLHEELKQAHAHDQHSGDTVDDGQCSNSISVQPVASPNRKDSVDSSVGQSEGEDYETCDSGLNSERSSVELFISGDDENDDISETTPLNASFKSHLTVTNKVSSSVGTQFNNISPSHNTTLYNNSLKDCVVRRRNISKEDVAYERDNHMQVSSERIVNSQLSEDNYCSPTTDKSSNCHLKMTESETISKQMSPTCLGDATDINNPDLEYQNIDSDTVKISSRIITEICSSQKFSTCTSIVNYSHIATEVEQITHHNDTAVDHISSTSFIFEAQDNSPDSSLQTASHQQQKSTDEDAVKHLTDKSSLHNVDAQTASAEQSYRSNDCAVIEPTQLISCEQSHESCDSGASGQSQQSSDSGVLGPTQIVSSEQSCRSSDSGVLGPTQTASSEQSCWSSDSGVSELNLASQSSHESLMLNKPNKVNVQYRSIVSDVFDGNILSSVQCTTCERVSVTKETFQDLSLPIPTKERLSMLHGTHSSLTSCSEVNPNFLTWIVSWIKSWFIGQTVTLQDCLSAFFSADDLKGDNMYSCEKCRKLRNGIKFCRVLKLPEILCIHLKRFRHEFMNSSKIGSYVSFPIEDLDMSPYLHKNFTGDVTTYNLVSVICHHGTAGGGHYTAYCQNYITGQWYEFDDEYVTEVDVQQVITCEAYVLFYGKKCSDSMNSIRQKAMVLWDTLQESLLPFFISKQWINKFNTFSEPGPIDNTDFLCPHGGIKPNCMNDIANLVLPLNRPLWTYLFDHFGGGPTCTRLLQCPACQEEADLLQQRQKYELEYFLKLCKKSNEENQSSFYISLSWFKDWENFVRNTSSNPPGQIDNHKIAVVINGQNVLKKWSSNCQVSEEVWKFLHSTYGGGPELSMSSPI